MLSVVRLNISSLSYHLILSPLRRFLSSSSPPSPVSTSSELYTHLTSKPQSSEYITVDVRPMEEIRATFGRTIDEYVWEKLDESLIKYVHLDDVVSGEVRAGAKRSEAVDSI